MPKLKRLLHFTYIGGMGESVYTVHLDDASVGNNERLSYLVVVQRPSILVPPPERCERRGPGLVHLSNKHRSYHQSSGVLTGAR